MIRSLICFVLLAGTVSAGQISVPLVNVDPQQLNNNNSISETIQAADESRGWAFTLTYRTLVTHFAWNDTNRDGLSHSHRVGIWRNTLDGIRPGFGWYFPQVSADSLVVQTLIPAGTAAELSGPWRRVPIQPILLQPGQYHIVGQNYSDSTDETMLWATRGPHTPDEKAVAEGARIAGLSFGQDTFGPVLPGHWIPYPGDYAVPAALMGPMLFVQVIVPEPATFAMIVGSACVASLARRRRPIEAH